LPAKKGFAEFSRKIAECNCTVDGIEKWLRENTLEI
jgi:hypothetical protein